MIDQTKADQLVQDKTQTQRRCHDDLLDGRQGEIILENSKSFACSICKSRCPNNAWTKDYNYEELLEATEGFSIENSLSEREHGPTIEGLLERQVKIQLFINARHKNMVMLLVLCTNKSQLTIVYEQVCNGSLE